MTHWALLGSPFLGSEAWTPVARELGSDSTVVSPRGGTATEVLDSLRTALPDAGDLLLVPHSNAGLYAATLAAERRVEGILFVDALLPGEAPTTPVTSPALRDALTARADADGLLPPWTEWWEGAYLDGRSRVEAGQPRVPAAYLGDSVPTPAGWADLPCGYLAFGTAYAEELGRAERLGWPVRRLEGGHLHQVVAPEAVAGALRTLAEELVAPGRRGSRPGGPDGGRPD